MLSMCLAIKCYTVCSLDIYIILMPYHSYVMFDLAFTLVLTLEYLTLVLDLELLSLESCKNVEILST